MNASYDSGDTNGALKLPPPPPPTSSTQILKIQGSDGSKILPPMSLGPGNYDRAWNDPPMFGTEINTMGKSVPTKLNKRVAYPGLGISSSPGGVSMIPSSMSGDSSSTLLPTPDQTTQVELIPSFPSPGGGLPNQHQKGPTDPKPQEI